MVKACILKVVPKQSANGKETAGKQPNEAVSGRNPDAILAGDSAAGAQLYDSIFPAAAVLLLIFVGS